MKKKKSMFDQTRLEILLYMVSCAVLMIALWLMVFVVGCADRQLTVAEQLRVTSYGAGELVIKAHEAYDYLEVNLPERGQDDLQAFAEPLNDARDMAIDYVALAIAVSEGEETDQDPEVMRQEVRAKIVTLLADLVELGIKYGVDVKEEIKDEPKD
jgi:hypothetical protein